MLLKFDLLGLSEFDEREVTRVPPAAGASVAGRLKILRKGRTEALAYQILTRSSGFK
jgi:hypothetical protein